MKRRIRKMNDGRQEIRAYGTMSRDKAQRQGKRVETSKRDESEGDSALLSGQWTARGGRIRVSYVDKQEVPEVFLFLVGTCKGCARGTDPRGGGVASKYNRREKYRSRWINR